MLGGLSQGELSTAGEVEEGITYNWICFQILPEAIMERGPVWYLDERFPIEF